MAVIFFLAVFFLFFSGVDSVSAGTYEFFTYGGFDAAVEAWKRVALIFSDKNFSGLIFVGIVLGALILFYSFLVRAATGIGGDPVRTWFIPVLGGMIVAAALILPKDTLVIYDEVLGRGPVEINGIPRILAVTAYFTNRIERGIIEIIDTSVPNVESKYLRNAGGLGYMALHRFTTKQLDFSKDYVTRSLYNYIKNCVFFEIQRSSGQTVNFEKIARGELTFENVIKLSENPSVYVDYYNPDGSVVSGAGCDVAGEAIIGYLNTEKNISDPRTMSGQTVRNICKSIGYDSNNQASFDACVNTVQATLNRVASSAGLSSTTVPLDFFWYQLFASHILEQVLLSNDLNYALSVIASTSTMSSFWGLGMHANSWIPILKQSLTALAVGISPFILALAATPLVGRALSVLFGLFVWLVCWGVVDAVIFTFGCDLASRYVPALGTYTGVGTVFLMTMPSYTARVVATFGALRWAGLGLATVLTTLLIRFGGTVLALLAGQVASTPMEAGQRYGSQLGRVPGSVFINEIASAQAMGAAAVASGSAVEFFRGTVASSAFQLASQASSGRALEDYYGNLRGVLRAGGLAGLVSAFNLAASASTGEVLSEKAKEEGVHPLKFAEGSGIVDAGGYIYPGEYVLQANELFRSYFGRPLTESEMAFVSQVTGKDIGKTQRFFASLRTMQVLSEQGLFGSFFTPQEREVFSSGRLDDQLMLISKKLQSGQIDIRPTDRGVTFVSFNLGEQGESLSVAVTPDGKIYLHEAELPGDVSVKATDIMNAVKSMIASRGEEIAKDLAKIQEHRDSSFIARTVADIFTKSFRKAFEDNLKKLAEENKEVREFYEKYKDVSKDTYTHYYGKFGLGLSVPIPYIPAVSFQAGAGYEHGSRHSTKEGARTGEGYSEGVRTAIQEAYQRALTEATEDAFRTLKERGIRTEDVISFAEKIGARDFAQAMERYEFAETVGRSSSVDLSHIFFMWYAEKKGMDYYSAYMDILKKVSDPSSVGELRQEVNQFTRDVVEKDDFMKRVKDNIDELNKKVQLEEIKTKIQVEDKVPVTVTFPGGEKRGGEAVFSKSHKSERLEFVKKELKEPPGKVMERVQEKVKEKGEKTKEYVKRKTTEPSPEKQSQDIGQSIMAGGGFTEGKYNKSKRR